MDMSLLLSIDEGTTRRRTLLGTKTAAVDRGAATGFRGDDRVELTWFRQPGEKEPGTLNLCFNAIDLHVVRGRAREVAVMAGPELDYATLLEQTASLAGSMRGLGVIEQSVVAVDLQDDLERLLVLLACLRLGAVYAERSPSVGDALLLIEDGMVGPAVKAGRPDPAACLELAPGTTAYVVDDAVVALADGASHASWPGRVCATLCAGQPLDLTGDPA
jgi:AMP-binding enzyme